MGDVLALVSWVASHTGGKYVIKSPMWSELDIAVQVAAAVSIATMNLNAALWRVVVVAERAHSCGARSSVCLLTAGRAALRGRCVAARCVYSPTVSLTLYGPTSKTNPWCCGPFYRRDV